MHRVGAFAFPQHSIKRDRPGVGAPALEGVAPLRRNKPGVGQKGERGATLCGDRGAREQKNRRFFVQVNISARGPCLTGNALLDPSCTTDERKLLPLLLSLCGCCGGSDCYAAAKRSGQSHTIVVVREENYFIFRAADDRRRLPWGIEIAGAIIVFFSRYRVDAPGRFPSRNRLRRYKVKR